MTRHEESSLVSTKARPHKRPGFIGFIYSFCKYRLYLPHYLWSEDSLTLSDLCSTVRAELRRISRIRERLAAIRAESRCRCLRLRAAAVRAELACVHAAAGACPCISALDRRLSCLLSLLSTLLHKTCNVRASVVLAHHAHSGEACDGAGCIGSRCLSSLCLADAHVSAEHGRICVASGLLELRDLSL